MGKNKAKNIRSLLEQSFDIRDVSTEEAGSLAFMAKVLIQATLPHKDPGDVIAWGRQDGDFSLIIKPGVGKVENEWKSYGLPYGSIPRLLLAWITTEVCRTKEKRVFLGNSLSEFMKKLGIVPTGGQWGSITRVREQGIRLFNSSISFQYNNEERQSWLNMQIAPEGELWWEKKEEFTNWIELGDKFYDSLVNSPVPIDMRALKTLKQSPLALDLYMWLTYRMSYLDKKTAVSWKSLQQQFGSDYSDTHNFTKKSKLILKKIQLLYPDLKLEEVKGRLILHPSPTHVKKVFSCG